MKPEAILQADLLDIIFENRNKEYGAYMLRRDYNRRLLIAQGGIPVFLLLLFTLNIRPDAGAGRAANDPFIKEDYKLKQVTIPEPVVPKTAAIPVLKKVATIKNPVPVIVPDEVKTDPLPSIDELMQDKALIGLETIDGPEPEGSIAPPATPPGTGEGLAKMDGEENKVHTHVERMPEFPGGNQALYRFLSKHLRVPEGVIEPGQRVRLPVRFVVNMDGQLSDVEFLGQAEEAFKKEVLRVVNKMPRWKPGYQNGNAVPVYFLIPIIFEVPE